MKQNTKNKISKSKSLLHTLECAIEVIGLTLFDGKLTMWRDNLPALTVDADGESEPIKIALRLGETWGVFKNCATFSKIKIVK